MTIVFTAADAAAIATVAREEIARRSANSWLTKWRECWVARCRARIEARLERDTPLLVREVLGCIEWHAKAGETNVKVYVSRGRVSYQRLLARRAAAALRQPPYGYEASIGPTKFTCDVCREDPKRTYVYASWPRFPSAA